MSVQILQLDAPPLLDMDATDEHDALVKTARLLDGNDHMLDSKAFLEAMIARQKINPPLLGNGVALPHARTPAVREIVCVAARCVREIPFGPDQTPVQLIFMFGIPPAQISQYLALVAGLARRLRRPETLAALVAAESAEDFAKLLTS